MSRYLSLICAVFGAENNPDHEKFRKLTCMLKAFESTFPAALLTAMFIAVGIQSYSQIRVQGYVYDQNAKSPVPFANVMTFGGNRGAATDTLGHFSFLAPNSADSLRITNLGYQPEIVSIANLPDTIFMRSVATELGVFSVTPGVNPAFAVLDRVVAHKKINNTAANHRLRYNEYQKIRFDLNHFTEKIKKNILVKPFDYLWENEGVDSNGVRYLPALLIEKSIEHFQNPGKEAKAIVQGEKVTGLSGPRLMDFANDLYILPDIYESFIPVLDKNFPSPIHDGYQRYYRYYLMDSIPVNGRKTYLITYKPKFVSQRAFSGVMRIDSASSAVVDISLKFDVQANVNFVRSYLITQSYELLNDSNWVVGTSRVLGDFTVVENSSDLTGFFGRKVSVFDQYELDTEYDDRAFSGPLKKITSDTAHQRTDAFWQQKRKVPLNEADRGIEEMIARLDADPKFIFRKNLILAVGSGYIPLAGGSIGDIYTFYNYNQVEFGRFKLGGRIKETESRPFQLEAFGAYGLRDDRWKYGLSGYYRFDLASRKKLWLGAEYKNDIEQLGRSYNLIPIDHVFASIGQFENDDSRYYMRRASAFAAIQPVTGISFLADYRHENYETIFLSRGDAAGFIDQVYTSGSVGITAKLSWLNTKMNPFYEDPSALKKRFARIPDIYVHTRYGAGELGSDADYWQTRLTIQQYIPVGNAGYTRYRLEGAKTWGEMPYVFAELPYANQILFNDELALNLMNFMEFYTDEFVQLSVAHHFDGWILDRIPLIKKLKWRSFLFSRTLLGRANLSNPYLDNLPDQTTILQQPYYEWGFGVENIFKFARVDFVWRETANPSLQNHFRFMVKPSFRFSF